MTRIILIVLAMTSLTACTTGPTAQPIAASDDAECQSYGTRPGTEAYFQCRMTKDQQRKQNQAALDQAYLASAIPAMTRPYPSYDPSLAIRAQTAYPLTPIGK